MSKKEPSENSIFDPIRQKWVACTPEERVRQAFVHRLVHACGYPSGLIANEQSITVGQLQRRCDTVVYDRQLRPLMVVEYKNPSVRLSQDVVEQAFRYNSVLGVLVIAISNGTMTIAFRVGYGGQKTKVLTTVPDYEELLKISEENGGSIGKN